MNVPAAASRILGPSVCRALASTWTVREILPDGRIAPPATPIRQAVYVLWHAELLPQALLHRNSGIAVLVSRHRDGEHLAAVLSRLGYVTVRGSSTRGGATGILGLLEAARVGRPLALTPDGPRGPRRRCKPGAIAVAAATGLPLIPSGAAAAPSWHIRSWDGFVVPRPGARVYVSYGEAMQVPPGLEGEGLRDWVGRIERAIETVSCRCRAAAAHEGSAS